MYPYGGPHHVFNPMANASTSAQARARAIQESAEKKAKKMEEKARRAMYLHDDDWDFEPEYGYDDVYAGTHPQLMEREMERGRREGEKRGRAMGREFERAAEERQRAAEERDRAFERARREREMAHAQMQSSLLHVADHIRSTSRSRSRSASRNRKDNTLDITLNMDDVDSGGSAARLVDLLTSHVSPAAASGANVNIHIKSVANSGSKRNSPEPPVQSHHSSRLGIPNPGFEAPGRARGRSPSPNPSLAPNPKSSGSRRPSPSPARAPAKKSSASASSTPPVPMPTPKHSRAPSPNPTPKPSKKPQTVETTLRVSEEVKKSYATLDKVRTQFERQRSEFVFPSVIDFQMVGNPEAVVSVNVRWSVEEIVASSVAQDTMMDLDVDLAEETADEEISMPKLAYTSTNSGIYNHMDVLEKLIIRLDGIASHGDEGLRLSRRKLVKEIGGEVERVERFWTGVWKEEKKEEIAEENITIEVVPEMQDGRASPELTLTVEPPVEEVDAMQIDDVDEELPVHVERPDSATCTSDEKLDHKDHAVEPDDWVDVAPSTSASVQADKAAEAEVPSTDVGFLDADVDLDDQPPSYEQSMSLTFSDGLPDQDQVGVEAVGEEENLETSTSTLSSMSEKDNKEKKVRRPRGHQLHVVNGDGEQDAEWVPVSAKGL